MAEPAIERLAELEHRLLEFDLSWVSKTDMDELLDIVHEYQRAMSDLAPNYTPTFEREYSDEEPEQSAGGGKPMPLELDVEERFRLAVSTVPTMDDDERDIYAMEMLRVARGMPEALVDDRSGLVVMRAVVERMSISEMREAFALVVEGSA